MTRFRFTRRAALGAFGGHALWWSGCPVWAQSRAEPAGQSQPVPEDATIAFTGHSMMAALFPVENRAHNSGVDFPSLWQGKTHFDFIGWSSNIKRWRAKGYARTGDYDLLVMTEYGDLTTGLADPASPQGRQNLQALYWFAMTAIAKGARPVLYMPWSPVPADLDDPAQRVFHYERQWLEAHCGQPVWIIPAGLFVRAVRDLTGDDSALFADPVHLRGDGPVPTGLSYLTWQFLTKRRVPNPPLFPEMEALAWQVLQDYRWSGFGGGDAVPALDIPDPLPDPAPPPAG